MHKRSPWASGAAKHVNGAGAQKQFVILASRFNQPITRRLVRGAADVLRRAGASSRNIRLLWVPGAFELPVAASHVATRLPRPDAIIAVGTLIRGDTAQYEVIARAVAQGLTQVSVRTGVPVTFGVIVAETAAQAAARSGLPAPRRQARQAGGSICNRGAEAAQAALSVLKLFDRLPGPR